MSIRKSRVIRVGDLEVDVVRKDVKNLHIGVYPPFGRVRVASPKALDDEAIRNAVASRLRWIREKRRKIRAQARETKREYVDGETHFVWGRRYRLRVIESGPRKKVELQGDFLRLHVPEGAEREQRGRRLDDWYRGLLREEIPRFVSTWAPRLGVNEPEWKIKRMKTKWGTCNPTAERIWINLELAKKPLRCLEFIVVHEMIHLLERNHTERFYQLQDQFLPDWRTRREELNRLPLSDTAWSDWAASDG